MKKIAKILPFLIAITLVCAALVTVISADSEAVARVGATEYTSLEAAIEAAPSGSTVLVLADVSVSEPMLINKNIKLDLGGNTVTTWAEKAFVINSDNTFEIVGEGVIDAINYLVWSERGNFAVSVTGGPRGIHINSSKTLVGFASGSLTLNNVTVDSSITGDENEVFTALGTAALNLIDTEITFTGNSAYKTVVSLSGSAHLYMNYSTILSDACCINVSTGATGKSIESGETQLMELNNSRIISRGTRKDSTVIGRSSTPDGIIVLRNCYVEGGYRLIELKCDVTDEEFSITPETNITRVDAYDTAFYHNGFTTNSVTVSRTTDVYLYGNSWVGSSKTNSVTASDAYHILLTEGARIGALLAQNSRLRYYDLDTQTEYIPGEDNCPYVLVYDPMGNNDAPYKLVKAESTTAIIPAKQVTLKDLCSSSEDGVVASHTDGTSKAYVSLSNHSGTLINSSGFWWNFSGIVASVRGDYTVDGDRSNTAFKYYTPDNFTIPRTATFAFGYSKSDGLNIFEKIKIPSVDTETGEIVMVDGTENLYKAFTVESQFSTDSGEFTPFAICIQTRNKSSGDTQDHSTAGFSVNKAGSVTFKKATDTGVAVTTDAVAYTDGRWNDISIIIYRNETAEGDNGIAYFYLNGTLIGYDVAYDFGTNKSGDAYRDGNAYLYGIRYDITTDTSNSSRALLVDNVYVKAYTSLYAITDTAKCGNYEYDKQYFNSATTSKYAPVSVGGVLFESLDSALTVANSLGGIASLEDHIDEEITITENCSVYAGGYTLNLSADSYAADIPADENGKPICYTFDSTYNSLTIDIGWYVGPQINPDYNDENNYVFVDDVVVGTKPTFSGTVNGIVDLDAKTVGIHSGWTVSYSDATYSVDVPILTVNQAKYIISNYDGYAYFYPTFENKPITAVVLDAEGNATDYLISEDFSGEDNAWQNFEDGETFVLFADLSTGESATRVFKDGTYGIDLNGYKMTYTRKSVLAQVVGGATVNVYSSVPGGEIFAAGKEGTKIGGIAFSMRSDAGDSKDGNKNPAVAVNNSLNIGKFGDIPGANLTLSGDCLIETRQGDVTSSVTVEGATLIRSAADYGAAILSRYYFGTITVKNLAFLGLASPTLIGNHTDGDHSGAVALINNVKIICDASTAENEKKLVGPSSYGFDSITVTNVESAACLNSANGGVYYNENCATVMHTATVYNGYTKANYNVPMTYSGATAESAIKVPMPSLDADGNVVFKSFAYIAGFGADANAYQEMADAGCVIVLPLLNKKVVKNEDAFSANYLDLEGNVILEEKYARGGKLSVTYVSIPSVVLNVLALIHDGSWTYENADVVDNVTITPGCRVVATTAGVMMAADMSEGVGFDLYIPIRFKNYVKSVKVGESAIEIAEEDTNGDNALDYVVARYFAGWDKLTDELSFTVTLEESGYEASFEIKELFTNYVRSALSNPSVPESDKARVYAMLDYANEAVAYFGSGYNTTLADMVEEFAAYDSGYAVSTDKAVRKIGLGKVFTEARMKLDGTFGYAFKLKEGFVGTVSVKIGINTVTYNVNAEESAYLIVDGICAQDLYKTLAITANGTVGEQIVTASGSYNLETYAAYHIANAANADSATKAESEACLALLEAMLAYSASEK